VPRFLLGSECLLELARGVDNPQRRWLRASRVRGIVLPDLAISAMSPALIARTFRMREQSAGTLDATMLDLRERCELMIQEHRIRGTILPVSDEAVSRWRLMDSLELRYRRRDGTDYPMGIEEQLVLATAMAAHLTLVDRRQPAHAVLAPPGLLIEDPEADKPEGGGPEAGGNA
jgi:hypothetical protein